MHRLNGKYARDYHKRHGRYGHFWINSYRCSIIDTDSYALTCMRYLDRNPIRAGITKLPGEWPWSAYNFYIQGKSPLCLNAHASFLGLAPNEFGRQDLYRKFVADLFPEDEMREKQLIRLSLQQYKRRKS
jgi:putative transposase